jgi:hypothetical protein
VVQGAAIFLKDELPPFASKQHIEKFYQKVISK